ncbi:hemerythrin domain-containing protein [Candidatus Woesearchaeota archaeon]|nr:hemerythrin domain-containing protein [Candidatus Woesearchaeota archaeon]
MTKPTEMLSREHQNILKVTNALLRECSAIDSGKGVDRAFFEKALDFIKNYADKFHHMKEEDILFVELSKDGVQMHCGPMEQMVYEHNIGRGHVKGMEEGLGNGDKGKLISNARAYAQLLQEHIYKEDYILYPMADGALSDEMQKSILERFEGVMQKFGSWEKYDSIAAEFEKRQ